MDSQSIKEVFKELYSHLERLEAQNTAILLFLKEKKQVTDKQLAPYLEQAGNAANVKWRAERVRMEYLLAQASEEPKPDEKSEKESAAPPEIEQNKSDKEDQEQAAPASSERDDSADREKSNSENASEFGHDKKPDQYSGYRTEPQSESTHEVSDEKEEGGQKVA